MNKKLKYTIILSLFVIITKLNAQSLNNGFDLNNALIPADKILAGGPGRDSIPAIDHPHFGSRLTIC
jgi:hypothetical protein